MKSTHKVNPTSSEIKSGKDMAYQKGTNAKSKNPTVIPTKANPRKPMGKVC